MTTELERLKAWMARNDMDADALHAGIGYRWPIRRLHNMLDGKRRIHDEFRMVFGRAFGNEALREVFGIDKGSDRSWVDAPGRHRAWRPEVYAAHRAVVDAVNAGNMLPACAYKCHACEQQARDWHHQSYLPEDRLCVVPLCRKCHRLVHNQDLGIDFGVVPTAVGLIRIAIADTPIPNDNQN